MDEIFPEKKELVDVLTIWDQFFNEMPRN